MSYLFLVRHGQASFLEPDYDKLSAKGETQSRLLGEYWAERGVVFDRVYTGPRVRQRETARIAAEAFKKKGQVWPEPALLSHFDEFQAEAVMSRSMPHLAETDGHIRKLHQDFQNANGRDEKFKTFQRVFEIVIARWAMGELSVPGIEPWPDFCARVHSGLQQLAQEAGSGQSVAIFSSGGPIGVAMQRALDLSTMSTLRSAWMVRNSAYSEFFFSGERFTLNSYNSTPHLNDPALITYR